MLQKKRQNDVELAKNNMRSLYVGMLKVNSECKGITKGQTTHSPMGIVKRNHFSIFRHAKKLQITVLWFLYI